MIITKRYRETGERAANKCGTCIIFVVAATKQEKECYVIRLRMEVLAGCKLYSFPAHRNFVSPPIRLASAMPDYRPDVTESEIMGHFGSMERAMEQASENMESTFPLKNMPKLWFILFQP